MIDKPDNNETNVNANRVYREYPNRKPKGAWFALFIASLALFFTAAGIAAGYKHWQRMHERAKDNARQIEAIQMALPSKTDSGTLEKLRREMTDNVDRQQTATEKHLKQMSEMRTQTEQFAATVTSQIKQVTSLQSSLKQAVKPANEQDWQIAEITFLLTLAIRELQLSGNLETAKGALRTADKRLSEIGSVNYLPVRQQIARDLAALNAINGVDITSLSTQINGLLAALKPVPTLPESPLETSETPEQAVRSENNRSGSLWSGVLGAFNEAVIVRKLDNPIAASLDMETRQHLYRLIQLRIESLRLMALQQHDEAYHQQIILLRDSIKNYYPANESMDLLATLEKLDLVKLNPEIPDISGSLQQLEKTRQADLAGVSQ